MIESDCMLNASSLIFTQFTNDENDYSFTYQIDDQQYTITLSHNCPATISEAERKTVLFNIGMCYLLDLAELVVPQKISIQFQLTDLQLEFWKVLYQEVAKEKMYIHKLDLSLLNAQWFSKDSGEAFSQFDLPSNRTKKALCLTGGKESLTLLKLMETDYKHDLILFFLNPETSIHRQKVFDRVKNDFNTIRTISNRPQILSDIKAKYQTNLGSGVDMAHLVFNTLLFGCEFVLIGNEYSANFPNLVYQGYPINHQYIKSIYFAEKINNYLHSFVCRQFSYFSLFFGLYEYRIASQLFKNDKYLEVWTSCNQTTSEINFCSNCHKCAFTYLVSSIYTSQIFLEKYFSRDLLEDVELFRALMDFTGEKPLDCVGEKIEVWVAMNNLSKRSEQKDKAVIKYFIEKIKPFIMNELPKFENEVNSLQKVPLKLPPEMDKLIFQAYSSST